MDFGDILEMLRAGNISKRQAALKLRIGHDTLLRELEHVGHGELVERRTIPKEVHREKDAKGIVPFPVV